VVGHGPRFLRRISSVGASPLTRVRRYGSE
jgi:hypothetical protein